MACIRKVGVLGQGHVGAHVANSLLVQGLVDELYLCDINAQKLTSETQDFTDALSFYPHNCKIVNCGDEYEKLAGCDVIVNAAGDVASAAKDRDGELFVTSEIARTFIARVTDAGFKGVWVSISNPCDVICTEIWRLSGCDPKRIVGSAPRLTPRACATPSPSARAWTSTPSTPTCSVSTAPRSLRPCPV